LSITATNIHFLEQGLSLTRTLDPAIFAKVGGLGGQRGSIGAHLRHCIDCARCFLEGQATGRIDYDARGRNLAIEHEPTSAEAALLELIEGFQALEGADIERPLKVRVDAAAWKGSSFEWGRSSLGRELQFLLSHTIHHYALIAMLARSENHSLDPEFGVAPSTLEHRAEAALSAP
jgi:hypothetical protein